MRKKFVIWAALGAGCVLGLWFIGRPAYRQFRENRSVAHAQEFMAERDFRNASLSARQALQINPSNLQACRVMAELADLARSPAGLDWRRRIADIAPSVENKLMLASVALRAQAPPFPIARQVLDDLAPQASNGPAWHVLSAESALRLQKPRDAEHHFDEASRLEPGNEMHQLNLAVLRLGSTNVALSGQARTTLEALCVSTNFGPVALRWLVSDRLAQKDLAGAESYSSRLLGLPRATLDDRLQHLAIVQQLRPADLAAGLGAIQRESTNAPSAVYSVSAWMISHQLGSEALAWLNSLSPKLKAEQPVPLAFVDAYLAGKEWAALDTYLQEQKWGDLDFLRFAFLSHVAANQHQDFAADNRWRMALQHAGDRFGALNAMLTMAGAWGRQRAREDLLWEITQRFAREKWAAWELYRTYQAAGDTRGLNRVYRTLTERNPSDFVMRNNYASTAMLLGINLLDAHQAASELYSAHPAESVIACTYAFSLHLQAKTKQGLAVLEKLKPEDLESPSIALYYGCLLAADRQETKAQKYFDIARQTTLLPEERKLLSGSAG